MALDMSRFSLVVLKSIGKVADALTEAQLQYDGIIEEEESDEDDSKRNPDYAYYDMRFVPVNKSLKFYFKLFGARDVGSGNIAYSFKFQPQSEINILAIEVEGNITSVLNRFGTWAELIKSYGTINLSKKEKFTAESAEQFYADFELADEDANTAPFDNDKQVLVYKLLDFVKDRLEQAEGVDTKQVKEIVQEINTLQAHIPIITKAALLKEVSKIYAKVKTFSMQVFVAVYDVAKKEVIKAALYGGLNEANVFIHNLHIH